MAIVNALGNSLTGQTGSGLFVGATSPTLSGTPVLGAANATSINFGQNALNYYEEGTWTPTFTFDTPGNLSVSYSTQAGYYTRIGRLVIVEYVLTFTPTYTTASGAMRIGGLPFVAANVNGAAGYFFPVSHTANLTYPAGTTSCICRTTSNSTEIVLLASGSATSTSNIGAALIPTTLAQTIRSAVIYHI